jgi:hypothetical protein
MAGTVGRGIIPALFLPPLPPAQRRGTFYNPDIRRNAEGFSIDRY